MVIDPDHHGHPERQQPKHPPSPGVSGCSSSAGPDVFRAHSALFWFVERLGSKMTDRAAPRLDDDDMVLNNCATATEEAVWTLWFCTRRSLPSRQRRSTSIQESSWGGPVDRTVQAGLLGDLIERLGPAAGLAAGRRLDVVASEPLVLSLLNSASPAVLLDKIDRLNRFLHSHHRHVVDRLDAHGVEPEHRATAGSSPSPVESLFVCGPYLELLARIGCRNLTCAFPDASTGARDVYCRGAPERVPVEGTGRWRIGWTGFEPARPLPGLDDVLLRDLPSDLTDRSTSGRVDAIVRTDPGRSWRLGEVAQQLAVSPRTLQRRLRDESRSFSEIVRSARISAAKELMSDPSRTLTDIGYVTGFSDTAHFARTFKAATGSTPSQWRAARSTSADRLR